MSTKDFIDGVQKNLYTIVDVRTPEEYHLEHIAGAINMPLERFQDHICHNINC